MNHSEQIANFAEELLPEILRENGAALMIYILDSSGSPQYELEIEDFEELRAKYLQRLPEVLANLNATSYILCASVWRDDADGVTREYLVFHLQSKDGTNATRSYQTLRDSHKDLKGFLLNDKWSYREFRHPLTRLFPAKK